MPLCPKWNRPSALGTTGKAATLNEQPRPTALLGFQLFMILMKTVRIEASARFGYEYCLFGSKCPLSVPGVLAFHLVLYANYDAHLILELSEGSLFSDSVLTELLYTLEN